jgi:hypothetical protein
MLALRARVLPALLVAVLTTIGASRGGRQLRIAFLGQVCFHPAPLHGKFDPRAPGYIVIFRRGMDAKDETERLEADYGFSATWVWTITPGFSAGLDESVRDMLRCEPAVEFIEYNALLQVAGG